MVQYPTRCTSTLQKFTPIHTMQVGNLHCSTLHTPEIHTVPFLHQPEDANQNGAAPRRSRRKCHTPQYGSGLSLFYYSTSHTANKTCCSVYLGLRADLHGHFTPKPTSSYDMNSSSWLAQVYHVQLKQNVVVVAVVVTVVV